MRNGELVPLEPNIYIALYNNELFSNLKLVIEELNRKALERLLNESDLTKLIVHREQINAYQNLVKSIEARGKKPTPPIDIEQFEKIEG